MWKPFYKYDLNGNATIYKLDASTTNMECEKRLFAAIMKLFLILPQNLIAHPYFWGYMISIIPGGRLAELKSPKILMEISIIVNVGALALSPIAAHIHTWLLVAVRLLQGIADSVALPAMHMIISKWAPPNERHVIASIVYAGAGFIIATSVMLTELIYVWLGTPNDSPAASHYLFCFQATLCFIWSILWYRWITDSPTEQTKYISEEEREYIVTSLKEHMGNFFKGVPWWQIFCSSPFMAIVIAHICSYFSYIMVHNTLHSLLPCISKHNTISATELLIFSIPCIGTWVFAIILSRVLATWQEKDVITVTRSRKISILFASLVPTLGLLLLTIRTGNRSDYTGKFMLMTIMMICMGGIFSGCYANHIDIAPKLAGSLLAITNFVALGVVVILFQLLDFVARSTRNKQDTHTIEWRMGCLVMIILYVIEIVVYTTCGSGKEQPWNQFKAPVKKTKRRTFTYPIPATETACTIREERLL